MSAVPRTETLCEFRCCSSGECDWRRVSAHVKGGDPFRVVAWLLNAISDRHLAAITMSRFRSGQVDPLPTRVRSCLCGIPYCRLRRGMIKLY